MYYSLCLFFNHDYIICLLSINYYRFVSRFYYFLSWLIFWFLQFMRWLWCDTNYFRSIGRDHIHSVFYEIIVNWRFIEFTILIISGKMWSWKDFLTECKNFLSPNNFFDVNNLKIFFHPNIILHKSNDDVLSRYQMLSVCHQHSEQNFFLIYNLYHLAVCTS